MYTTSPALRRSNLFERIRAAFHTPEKFYVLFALLYFVGAFSPSDLGENVASRSWQFNRISYFSQIAVFAILAVLLFVRWNAIARGIRHAFWPLSICALAVLSAGWSDDPFFTFRRAIVFLATTVFAVYFGSSFDWEDQIEIFGWLLMVSIAGSVLMVVLAPQFGISHDMHMGAFKGMFSHKNLLGRQMALGVLTVMVGKPLGMPRWVGGACLLAAFPLLALSRSAGALLSLIIVVAIYAMLSIPRPSRRSSPPLWIGLLPLVLLVAVLMIANAGAFLSAFGRDASLTGRVPLWVAIEHAIGRRFWLGYGYGIFWVRQSGSLQEVLATGWNALSAQNGYLDMGLDLGIVGLALFFCTLASAMRRGVHALHSDLLRTPKWPLLFLIFFALQNIHESDLIRLGTFMWIPFVATSVTLALMEAKSKSAAGEIAGEKGPGWNESNSRNPEHAVPVYES
ncbi:MAG: O-antigen ligase family protein [Candidatus Acidiferrum sp.]|jgi:exopolysaccharide production protein ExoQ